MNTERQDLAKLVRNNPDVSLAYVKDRTSFPELHIHVKPETKIDQLKIPTQFDRTSTNFHDGPTLKTLICPVPTTPSDDCHQCCQDEPVELGCQIQPLGANWVGTAGAPVSWIGDDHKRVYGILSNWHVMVVPNTGPGHPQHQPTTQHEPIAYLDQWNEVRPDQVNHYDAAIANALHDGFHTIDWIIIEIGTLNPEPLNATEGLPVLKSGRTSGRTQALCTAVGAAVRVGYGNFDAVFEDQDVFADVDEHFSAPGDSGSLICSELEHRPAALLFAGGGNLTIGNPIRYVVQAFKLSFDLY